MADTSTSTDGPSVTASDDSFDNTAPVDMDDLVAVDDRIEAAAAANGDEGTDDDDDTDDLYAAEHIGQHPALKTMCVIDCDNTRRIIPNGPPAILSNDCFEGRVMLLVRTPDVDDNKDHSKSKLSDIPARASSYFKNKKRRFEFQFQVKLKRIPKGPLFLGCELEHSIKVGAITKGLVGLLLAMVRRINPGFHYSWGPDAKLVDKSDYDTGSYEKTHLSFPVEASMDRIVITKPGEQPPPLGFELYESNESVKRRRKMGAGCVDWNLNDTYTMCLWSAYVDWIKWKSMNVPGVSPFLLSRVTGTQPIYLSVYEIDGITNSEYKRTRPGHLRKNLHVYTRLEFSNTEKTVGGLAERIGCVKGGNSSLSTSTRIIAGSGRERYRPTNGGGGGTGGGSSSERSLPDTEPLDSEFETASTHSRVTMT